MAITFDESSFPIIRVEIAGECSDQEYDAYHKKMTELLRKAASSGVKMGVVIDARASEPPTPKQRKRMADLLDETRDLQKRGCTGWSVVLASAVQRGVLTAVLWIRPFPVPHNVAATPAEGEAWLRSRMRAEQEGARAT
jgi:hypothetical protein